MEEYEVLWDAYLNAFLSTKLHLSPIVEGLSIQYLASMFHSLKDLPIKQRVLNIHARVYVYQMGTTLLSTLRTLEAVQKHTKFLMQQVDLLDNFIQNPQMLAENAVWCMYDAVLGFTSKQVISDDANVSLVERKRELREFAVAFHSLVSRYTNHTSVVCF